jgi:hypothetical protein
VEAFKGLSGWGVQLVGMNVAVPLLPHVHCWRGQGHLYLSNPDKRDSVCETGSRRLLYHFVDILEAEGVIPRSIISQLRY